jgi:hypothetical protein
MEAAEFAGAPVAPPPSTHTSSARLVALRRTAGGSELHLADGRCILVPAVPDQASARRVTSVLRRVDGVRIDLDGTPRASVLACTRRVPGRHPLPLGAALALAGSGVPTAVHRTNPADAREAS